MAKGNITITAEEYKEFLLKEKPTVADKELLITDKEGRFLFYGSYDVNDYEFIVDRFYETIQLLKNKIDTIEKRKEMPKVNFDKANLSVGWDMLKAYYNSKQESKDKEVNENE